MSIGCLGVDRRGDRFFVLNHFSDERLVKYTLIVYFQRMTSQSFIGKMVQYEKSFTTALHAQTSYRHGVNRSEPGVCLGHDYLGRHSLEIHNPIYAGIPQCSFPDSHRELGDSKRWNGSGGGRGKTEEFECARVSCCT